MGTGALEANLARTAVEVAVPDAHAALLEITDRWRGVHDATAELLREMHHRYVSWPQALADLHRRAMGDFAYHNAHERGAEALAIVADLYAKIAREGDSDAVRADAVRRWLTHLDKVVRDSGPSLARNAPVVSEALDRLGAIIDGEPRLARVASSGLRRLTESLAGTNPEGISLPLDRAAALLRACLHTTYAHWLTRDDPAGWWSAIRTEVALDTAPLPAMGPPSHSELLRSLGVLANGEAADAESLLALPDNAQIVRGYLEAAGPIGEGGDPAPGLLARIRWLLRMLEHPDLGSVYETALHEVSRTSSALLSAEAPVARERLVRQVFGLLRRREFPYPHTVLGLTARIGCEVLRIGDPDLDAALVDEVMAMDFEHPGFSGFTDEWGLITNPAHVEAIRTHLALIREDAVAARPLLAALVARLRLGGVSIPDSALFQREVSALLAADVRPVYVQVKHLLRVLPVFFSEIGSEGDLREASTLIDEASQRRDPLCHFLRKQCHVECNPHLMGFVEEIARFWATGDPDPLRRYVPRSVFAALNATDAPYRGLHRAYGGLVAREGAVAAVLALDPDEVRRRVALMPDVDPVDCDKAALLVRVDREIRRKYTLDHDDVVARMRAFGPASRDSAGALEAALAQNDLDEALDISLSVLERLQDIAQRPGESRPVERIYHKRHIAIGIPSIYGSYREERLDAMGLSFRLESLASALADRLMDPETLPPGRYERLRIVARWLHQLRRAVRIDGFRAQGLAHCLTMLDELLDASPQAAPPTLLNVFHLLSRNVEGLIRARILDVYEAPVQAAVARMVEQGVLCGSGSDSEEAVLRHSETLLRTLIAGSFGLQRLDALVGLMLHELTHAPPGTSPALSAERDLLRLDPAACVVRIGEGARGAGVVTLGNKGYMLCELARLGLSVPQGLVLTTGLFPARHELRRGGRLRERLEQAVGAEIARLEEVTGTHLGDPAAPLLLSVRGGAPVSMPGMLTTFLNVGMTVEIAEGLAARIGGWAAWDAYRRFVQFWGMAHGLARDPFDAAMRGAKRRSAVPRKALLLPSEMRTLALEYEALVRESGVPIEGDPFEQVMRCIELVHDSWDAEAARVYRDEVGIAEEWGTAVILQVMVFGNLGPRSGAGVVQTGDAPRTREGVLLTGDFTVQGQGDDVVGGVVETHPVSERERQTEGRGGPLSLERDFPAIHQALCQVGQTLVSGEGMNHQEIEFTFESDRPEGLYLLQTRDSVVARGGEVEAFIPSPSLAGSRVAVGIGVSGGALSGRVAHSAAEIDEVARLYPGTPVILLRPDTVPDDVALVVRSDGVLTALGGATSHAAVVAKRLGKSCVVGCRALDVDEHLGRSSIGGHELRCGDPVSISGLDGAVYIGSHAAETVRVAGRAQQ